MAYNANSFITYIIESDALVAGDTKEASKALRILSGLGAAIKVACRCADSLEKIRYTFPGIESVSYNKGYKELAEEAQEPTIVIRKYDCREAYLSTNSWVLASLEVTAMSCAARPEKRKAVTWREINRNLFRAARKEDVV